MTRLNPLSTTLIEKDDSVLVVIDMQDSFLEKLPEQEQQALTSRVGWLVHVAAALEIPVVVTAEDIDRMGSLTRRVADHLPADTPVYNKMVFGLADNPEILQTLTMSGRKTVILTGLETDVCVAHSAMGLMALDYRVAVVADAVGSPGDAHSAGLQRMQAAGVVLTRVRSLFYEWTRSVRGTEDLLNRIERREGFPEGITF